MGYNGSSRRTKDPYPPRVLAANLKTRKEQFPFDAKRSMIGDVEIVGGQGMPKIGITSVAGKAVEKKSTGPIITFEENRDALAQGTRGHAGRQSRVESPALPR